MSKQALRRRMRARRAPCPSRNAAAAGRAVRDRLFATASFSTARQICVYLSAHGELDTGPLRRACLEHGIRLCVPTWCPATRRYALARLDADTTCIPGPLGIDQPRQPVWTPWDGIEWVLAPGLAFDPAGGRLGQGGGHYDRMLKHCPTGCRRVGLAYDWQIVARVPMEFHDVRMDGIVTDQRTVFPWDTVTETKTNIIRLETHHDYAHHRPGRRNCRHPGGVPSSHADGTPTGALH